jgi:DNA-binding HxlR family transcriptional regulator
MKKTCAVYNAANIIGKRWAILILLEIYKGTSKSKRYHELKEKLEDLTPKILSTRLKDLEREGMITKNIDATKIPIKSEYALTRKGEDFLNVVQSIKEWSLRWGTYKSCKEKSCKECTS